MKLKSSMLIALLVIGFSAASAQEAAKGEKIVNLGLGLRSTLYSGSYYTNKVPPISASVEYVLQDDLFDGKGALGVGGYLGYTSAKYDYSGWGWKYTNIIIGPRGFLHYNLADKLDTYTGLLLGYNIVSSKEFGTSYYNTNYSATSSGVIWEWFIGGRYYFSDNFAGMLELGYGISYLNIGVSFKL